MKKITVTIAAITLAFSLHAQSVKEGEQLVNYGRYSSAVQSLQSHQNSEEGNYYLGLAELGMGNIDKAKEIFAKNSSFYSMAGKARILYIQGQKAEADKLLQEIVNSAKKKEWEKYKIAADAITYTQGGDIQTAIDWYTKALEREKNAKIYIGLGDAYLKLQTGGGQAMDNYEEAVKLGTDNSLAYSKIGYLWYSSRNYEAALKSYEQAKEADINNPLPYRDLADAYYRVGKFDLAKQNIEQYLKLSDKTADDEIQYVHILFLSKHYPEAIQKIDEVIKLGKAKPYMYRLKAYSEFETKDYVNAKQNLSTFFNTNKDANILIQDDFLYAGKIFNALATVDTSNRLILTDSADYYFNKAIAVDTAADKAETYRSIAESFKDAKNYAKTGEYYGKVVADNPNAPSLDYYYWGFYSYYGQKYDIAATAFQKMTEQYPADKHISLYWQGIVGAATDAETKTGAGEPYFLEWLSDNTKEKSNDQLMKAYQYLCFLYYNKDNRTKATEYANLIIQLEPSNQFATDILNYYKSSK